MDLTKILETIVSNLPPHATININVAQPGAPIYNNFGGAQFIGSTPLSRKKKTEVVEEPKDAIKINLDHDDDEIDDDDVPFDEDLVISQSGLPTNDDSFQEETASSSNDNIVNIDALIDEAIDDKGLEPEDSASVKLWAAKDPTKLQDALILAADELDADDGEDDIYTCLKDAGWSK